MFMEIRMEKLLVSRAFGIAPLTTFFLSAAFVLSGCGKLDTDPASVRVEERWGYDAPAGADYCLPEQLFGLAGSNQACLVSARVVRFSDGSAWFHASVSLAQGAAPFQVFSDFLSPEDAAEALSYRVVLDGTVFTINLDESSGTGMTLNFADDPLLLDPELAKRFALERL
jgi:hypothetical protein